MRPSTQLLSMSGRHILITGAASGIGKAMAARFADAGADLLLVDNDKILLEQTAKELDHTGTQIITCIVDLEHKAQIDRFWKDLQGEIPDTLINNAGCYPMQDYLEVTAGFLEKILRVNLEAAIWMCQHFIESRKGKGGVIINVSSVEALAPFRDDLVPYSVSKAGILALTRALAHAYGRHHIRVNVLVPGAIKTPSTAQLKKMAMRHLDVDLMKTGYHFANRLALGRWGEADEVARVALFLASDLASYVQGVALPVDGGFLSS